MMLCNNNTLNSLLLVVLIISESVKFVYLASLYFSGLVYSDLLLPFLSQADLLRALVALKPDASGKCKPVKPQLAMLRYLYMLKG